MGPGTATISALQRSFQFSGRSTRSEFWWSWVILYAVATLVMMFRSLPTTSARADALLTFVACAIALPMIAVGTRRLADAGVWRWLFVLTILLGAATQFLYMVRMPALGDLYAMSFQAERNDVTLPLSGYEMHHLLAALRDVVLPWAAQVLALFCLILALLPSRRNFTTPGPNPLEAPK